MGRPTKTEYILRMLSKIQRKKWESYVINGIIHGLGDLDIEFSCQQYVKRKDGQYALVDLYFPQFNIALEVDEPPHEKEDKKKEDKKRTDDIVAATGCAERRIKIQKSNNTLISLDELNSEISKFVAEIISKKASKGSSFHPWDYETRFQPKTHIDRGFIDIEHGVAFANHRDALRCFGYKKGHFQRAVWRVPGNPSWVWFPKFYENADWGNSVSDDGETITEIYKGNDPKHLDRRDPVDTRIVFAHDRDALGQTLYRFLGEFAPDNKEGGARDRFYRRVATRVDLAGFH